MSGSYVVPNLYERLSVVNEILERLYLEYIETKSDGVLLSIKLHEVEQKLLQKRISKKNKKKGARA